MCQAPSLSGDIQGDKFFDDATNIAGINFTNLNLTRANIQENTSQSLLTLAPKATIQIINKADPPGQYLMFIVTGNQ